MQQRTELRLQSTLQMQQADEEGNLASKELAQAQLAEATVRDEGFIQVIADAIVWNRQPRQQQPGFAPSEAEPAAREIMKRLANAGYKIVPISR